MSDDCAAGHAWEVWSGDMMTCMFCSAEGRVIVTSEGDEEE